MGWDVSLELPATGATPPWIVFIQFKLGEARTRSTYPGSMFARGASRAHVLLYRNVASNARVEVKVDGRVARIGGGAGFHAEGSDTLMSLDGLRRARLTISRSGSISTVVVDRIGNSATTRARVRGWSSTSGALKRYAGTFSRAGRRRRPNLRARSLGFGLEGSARRRPTPEADLRRRLRGA